MLIAEEKKLEEKYYPKYGFKENDKVFTPDGIGYFRNYKEHENDVLCVIRYNHGEFPEYEKGYYPSGDIGLFPEIINKSNIIGCIVYKIDSIKLI